jgi:hypothetical protein
MLKVTIKGEVFSFDHERYPLSEAIELEEGLGISFHEYRLGLQVGSAKSMAGFVWLVLRRNGKDVPLDDILSGAYELMTSDVSSEEEGGPDPTPAPSPEPGDSTSGSSPSDSESVPGSGTGSP